MTDPTDKTEDKYEYEIADGVILDTDKPEIQVIDDTPDEDKGRTPMAQAPADVTDEELTKYSDQKLKDRLAHLGKGYHEERRAKEAALREREEAVRVAQQVVAENQRLQGSLTQNQTVLLEQAKETAKTKLEEACFFAKCGMASKPENRLCQNSCEQCDEAAPAGKRFCSDACQIADQPSA